MGYSIVGVSGVWILVFGVRVGVSMDMEDWFYMELMVASGSLVLQRWVANHGRNLFTW